METSTTYTAVSYAVIASIVGAVAYNYYQKSKSKNQPGVGSRKGGRNVNPEPRKENKAKKQRLESFVSDVQESVSGEKATKSKSKPKPDNPWLTNAPDTTDEDKEFARQFSTVKEGAKLNTKSNGEQKRAKSVKQSQAAKVSDFADDEKPSSPSSTTGADADDDQSPAMSPEVSVADAGDVNDMLEPAAPGPSFLRIVDTDKVKQPAPKQPKKAEPVETKKQRQNRKKVEQAKAIRAEDEKERQVKMEAQRRLARISEGRPAKDGSQFMAAVNGNKNAWANDATNGADSDAGSTFIPVVPLDTFDSTTSEKGAGTSSLSQSLADSWVSLLSEEEQMQKAKEESEAWNTVIPKASKKGLRKESPTRPEKVEEPAAPVKAQPTPQPAEKKPKQNGQSAKPAVKSFGSFSALSTDDAEEKEWDV
jgi:hypothetical protein